MEQASSHEGPRQVDDGKTATVSLCHHLPVTLYQILPYTHVKIKHFMIGLVDLDFIYLYLFFLIFGTAFFILS